MLRGVLHRYGRRVAATGVSAALSVAAAWAVPLDRRSDPDPAGAGGPAGTSPAGIVLHGYDPANLDGPRPEIVVPRLERLPTLEDFLDMAPSDEFRGRMAHVDGGFVQRDPEDGAPASQHTDVYLAYDDDDLLVAFVAHDDEPDKIRANLGRRETVFRDDIVEIQIDTFLDRRRAYTFISNPLGVQFDAIWNEGASFDDSFDTVWATEGRLTETGYVVTMAIPFRSLRFPPSELQRWGILLVRDIPRNNESSFYPRMSNRIDSRLRQAGTMSGIRGVSSGRNVQLIPYATATSFRVLDADVSEPARFLEDSGNFDGGLDAKAVFLDGLVLDATINPDFSQVESDEAQVTANRRFEVFFEERRPFFLENAGTFATPLSLLFTRRIFDPRVGARLTGKVGRHEIGVLWSDDRAAGDLDPEAPDGDAARFGVVRWSRDIGRESKVGLLYTERRLGEGVNRVGGVDGRFRINDVWSAEAQYVHSRTRAQDGTTRAGPAAFAEIERDGRKLDLEFRYRDFDEEFETEAGFVPRVDLREGRAEFEWTFRPEGERLISSGPSVSVTRLEDQTGLRLDERKRVSWEFQFRRQTRINLFAIDERERLRPADFPTLAAPRDYGRDSRGISFRTNFTNAIDLDVRWERSDAIDFAPLAGLEPTEADEESWDVSLTVRPTRRLRIDTTWLSRRLDEPATGARIFDNEILRSRWNYQFDRRASLRVIGRLDTIRADPSRTSRADDESLNVDVLFSYIVNPWTAIYAGYASNETNRDIVGGTVVRTRDLDLRDARQAFVKVSYLIRL